MKVRSIRDVTQVLDDELAWRKRELTTLRFLLAERQRRHERTLLLRAAVCVLYAHWEGFIKAASAVYLSYVAARGLRYRDLKANFVALGFHKALSEAGVSNKATIRTALIEKLISGEDAASFDGEQAVGGYSNVGADTLAEVLCLLGLDEKRYVLKRQLLDQRLLRNRNLIAHGRPVEIEPDDYFLLHDEVLQLVQDFRSDVENAAASLACLR